jgi:hypothetical protein
VVGQPPRARQGVHVEQQAGTRQVGPHQPAARRQHQPVVADHVPAGVHPAGGHVDVLRPGATVADADGPEQAGQRDGRAFRLGLVHPRAQHEVLVRRDQRDVQVGAVAHARGRGRRPHPGETPTDDHDVRHVCLLSL